MSLTSGGRYFINKQGSYLRGTDLIKSEKMDCLDPSGSGEILEALPELLESGGGPGALTPGEPPRRKVTGKSAPSPFGCVFGSEQRCVDGTSSSRAGLPE